MTGPAFICKVCPNFPKKGVPFGTPQLVEISQQAGTNGTPETAKQFHVPLVSSPWNGTQVRINSAFHA